MRKIKILLGIVLCVTIFSSALVWGRADKSKKNGEEVTLSSKDLQRLTTVIDDVRKYYYKSIDDDTLFKRAISGMLAGLDPHSEYLDIDDLKDLEMVTLGKFGGVGVEVYPDQGAIKVVSPLDDTPAYKAGIKAGDYIVQINNKLVRDMSLRDAVNMMRGPKGSKLNLTIIRKNENKPLVFNLRREIIKIRTVKARMLESGYGYVRLAWFQEPTERDMVLAIKRLQKATKTGLKGLILDMRSNPGGLVESAVQVADDFLDAKKLKNNDLIVYTKGQSDEEMTAKATLGEILPNVPIVVLINDGSASASEIVAGALQDHKRAIVVGTRSFGKGSVQTLIPIDRTSAIKLTTALYYTPLGRLIQAKGIEPDINVENIILSRKDQDDQEIPRVDESALIDHIQNSNDVNDSSSDSDVSDKQQKQSKAELDIAYKDYQLYEALHILKSQNVMRNKDD
ncbi:MAG TPA: peptidase S41 [Coxiellaceae bacterium]|nr:peptidase S41 [Coxiellaceae bacterium]HBY55344.1 peptidase S41 [Coxiellaceae bacterium]